MDLNCRISKRGLYGGMNVYRSAVAKKSTKFPNAVMPSITNAPRRSIIDTNCIAEFRYRSAVNQSQAGEMAVGMRHTGDSRELDQVCRHIKVERGPLQANNLTRDR